VTPDAGHLLPAIRALSWLIFLGLWILVSIWDLKQKKILHRHLRVGLIFAAVSYALMLFSTFLGHMGRLTVYYQWVFYKDLVTYIATSLLISVAMWQVRMWPAGDAKLFAFLAVIFPMLSISGSFHEGWLFLDVLINIFIPASLSVFVQAAHYIWRTRIKHYRGFAAQMGLKRELDYTLERARAGAAAAAAAGRAALAEAAAEPRKTALSALVRGSQWIFSMFVMALISCALMGLIPTPFLRTVVIFGVFMTWQRLETRVDPRWSWLFVAVLLAALLSRGDVSGVGRELAKSFGYLSLFSICLSVGMQMSVGMMRGQLLMFAFPLLMGAVTLFPWGRLAFGGRAGAVLPLALMGLFFGVSFVFVRIWDDEEHPDIPLEKILSYMVMHRSFHKRLGEDPEFYQTHFESSYADGLTQAQVDALKEWCAEEGIATVPMTTTMSFAHWIFLGYFATWLLGWSVLKVLH
jgi:hypothetical protein